MEVSGDLGSSSFGGCPRQRPNEVVLRMNGKWRHGDSKCRQGFGFERVERDGTMLEGWECKKCTGRCKIGSE